jgi:hypothetical protein
MVYRHELHVEFPGFGFGQAESGQLNVFCQRMFAGRGGGSGILNGGLLARGLGRGGGTASQRKDEDN